MYHMKLLLLILGISLCCAFPSLGGYERIDPSQVQNSIEIQQLIGTGLQSIVQDGYSTKKLTNTDFQLDKINNIYKQVLDGESYKFDCNFKGKQNELIKASFEIHYQRTTSITQVKTFSYTVQTVSVAQSVQASYVQVNALEAQYSTEIQNVLDYGVKECVKNSIADKTISNSVYQIATVNTVYKQVVDSALFYKCDVDLKNKEGKTVQAVFTVYYQPFTSVTSLVDYLCNTKTTTTGTSVSTTGTNQQGNLITVSSNAVKGDSLASSILQYGLNEILQKGVQSGKIPNTQFSLTEITSFSKQTSSGKTTYNFKCSLDNSQGSTVQATFTVSYQISSQKKTLSSWSYNVKTTSTTTTTQIISPTDDQYVPISQDEIESDATIKGALQYGIDQVIQTGSTQNKIPKSNYEISEVSEAYSQIVGNWIFYKFSCTLSDNKNVVVKTTFTISYQTQTNKQQLTQYSYHVTKGGSITTTQTTTTTTNTQSVEGQYIACTEEEINTDITIQDILAYGTQQIYLKGVQAKKIPESNFKITSINSVNKQVVKNKGTFYKCDLVLDNSMGSVITTTFTVLYQSSSNQKSISEWSYRISTTDIVKTTSSEQGTYTDVSISTAQSNTVIQSCLNYGIDQIIQKAVEKGKISSSDFEITKIISVSKKTTSSGTYYKCQAELSNTEGSVITADFNVYYETKTSKKTLSSYSYDIKTTTKVVQPIEAAYTDVSQSEVSYSSEIQDCLSYGIGQVIQSSNDYKVSKINSVKRQIMDSAIYYKFDVELSSIKGSTQISFTFTIFYKCDTGEKYVKAYAYNTKSSITTSTSYKFSKVDVSKVKTNSKYQNVVQSGVKDCLGNLYEKQLIVTKDFTVSEIISFSQQITSSEKYRCRAKLTNTVGISLEISFEVSIGVNGKQSLSSYSMEGYTAANAGQALVVDSGVYDQYQWLVGSYDRLESTDYDTDSEVKACVDYGVQETVKKVVKKEKYSVSDFKVKEIKSVCRDSVNQNTYRVESTLVNSKGATVECNFLVKNQGGSTGGKELASYAYTAY